MKYIFLILLPMNICVKDVSVTASTFTILYSWKSSLLNEADGTDNANPTWKMFVFIFPLLIVCTDLQFRGLTETMNWQMCSISSTTISLLLHLKKSFLDNATQCNSSKEAFYDNVQMLGTPEVIQKQSPHVRGRWEGNIRD